MILKLPKKAQRHVKNESQQRFDIVLRHSIQKTKKEDKKIDRGERMPNQSKNIFFIICHLAPPFFEMRLRFFLD